jgi:poly-gamma-glutamate capsule biosynthesis protein CapA/YwtB (metallophosphatase superfamily)
MDETRGAHVIYDILRAEKVARITEGCVCRPHLGHNWVVETLDGRRICADNFRWVDQPTEEIYGQWL